MFEIQNIVYVHTQRTRLSLEGDALRADVVDMPVRRMPLIKLETVVVFGAVSISADLIRRCAEASIAVVWMTPHGRYSARTTGPTHGNIALRVAQYAAHADTDRRIAIARELVRNKAANSITFARDTTRYGQGDLTQGIARMRALVSDLATVTTLDQLRGVEGHIARLHFEHVRCSLSVIQMGNRTKRPPLDLPNCLLSFLYGLARVKYAGGAEAIGLDPQLGYLHDIRPGRPALALDLMEAMRPRIDRLVVTLLNRKQFGTNDVEKQLTGACYLTEEARKRLLTVWQEAQNAPIKVPHLKSPVALGMVPVVQARHLARLIRGDVDVLPHIDM